MHFAVFVVHPWCILVLCWCICGSLGDRQALKWITSEVLIRNVRFFCVFFCWESSLSSIRPFLIGPKVTRQKWLSCSCGFRRKFRNSEVTGSYFWRATESQNVQKLGRFWPCFWRVVVLKSETILLKGLLLSSIRNGLTAQRDEHTLAEIKYTPTDRPNTDRGWMTARPSQSGSE